MPKYSVKAPDGNTYQVDGPDGATDDQVRAEIMRQHPALGQPAITAQSEPPSRKSFLDKLIGELGGAGELGLHMGTGAVGALGGGLGYFGTLAATGGDTGAAKAVQEDIGNTLTYQPRLDAGKENAQALGDVGQWMGQKEGDLAGNALADRGHPVLGAIANTALNVPQFLLGMKAGTRGAAGARLPELNKPSGIMDVIRGNSENIAGNYVRSITGNPNTRRVLAGALDQTDSPVPGYPPTAAEAVSHLPQGTPIQALQQAVSSSSHQLPADATGVRGPAISQAYAQRAATQEAARADFLQQRDAITAGMRDNAMASAQPGVHLNPVQVLTDKMMSTPGVRASGVVKKAINSIRDHLNSLRQDDGTISPEDLYTVRKEMGNYIEAAAKDSANWDKRLAGKLQNELQDSFDTAIEQSGGDGWRQYLNVYSRMSQAEKAALDRQEGQYSPAQKTSLQDIGNIASNAQTHLPHVLSRTAVVANWLLSSLRPGLQGEVMGRLGDMTLNPENGRLAAALRKGIRPEDMAAVVAKRQALARALASGTIAGAYAPQQGQE